MDALPGKLSLFRCWYVLLTTRLYCNLVNSFTCFVLPIYSSLLWRELFNGDWGGWMIYHFSIVKVHFIFLWIESRYTFSISYIILTWYVYYYYCIWLCFNTLSSCFLAGFLLFKWLVMECDSALGSFCYSSVYFISRSCISFPATITTTM